MSETDQIMDIEQAASKDDAKLQNPTSNQMPAKRANSESFRSKLKKIKRKPTQSQIVTNIENNRLFDKINTSNKNIIEKNDNGASASSIHSQNDAITKTLISQQGIESQPTPEGLVLYGKVTETASKGDAKLQNPTSNQMPVKRANTESFRSKLKKMKRKPTQSQIVTNIKNNRLFDKINTSNKNIIEKNDNGASASSIHSQNDAITKTLISQQGIESQPTPEGLVLYGKVTENASKDDAKLQKPIPNPIPSKRPNAEYISGKPKRDRKSTEIYGQIETEINDDNLFDQINSSNKSNIEKNNNGAPASSLDSQNVAIDKGIIPQNEKQNIESQLTPGELILLQKITELSTDVKVLQKTTIAMEIKLAQCNQYSEIQDIGTVDEEYLTKVGLPLSNENEVEIFDKKLEQKQFYDQVYNVLKVIGKDLGNACGGDVIQEIINNMFSRELLSKMTWSGKGDKKGVKKISFKSLSKINDLIFILSNKADKRLNRKGYEHILTYKILKYAYRLKPQIKTESIEENLINGDEDIIAYPVNGETINGVTTYTLVNETPNQLSQFIQKQHHNQSLPSSSGAQPQIVSYGLPPGWISGNSWPTQVQIVPRSQTH